MRSYLCILAMAAAVAAKTDLSGCTSSDVIAYGGASVLYYVPGTGEICSFLDCGGGMAPPKTTVPGCPLYSGTATYSPSFLPGFKDGSAAAVSSTSYVQASSTSPSTAMVTGSSTVITSSTLSGAVGSSSTGLVTSAGTTSNTKSTSSTGPKPSGSGSGTSTSSAASSSNTSNAGASISVDLLAHGIVGAVAAGFAFLL